MVHFWYGLLNKSEQNPLANLKEQYIRVLHYPHPLQQSEPCLRLRSSNFRLRMFGLEVEVNLCSKVFHTSLEVVILTTREKTCGVRVELIKEPYLWFSRYETLDSNLWTSVLGRQEESVQVMELNHQCVQWENRLQVLWLTGASMECSLYNQAWLTSSLTYWRVVTGVKVFD